MIWVEDAGPATDHAIQDPECHGARMLLATSEGNDARDLNLTLSSDKRQDLAIASLNSLVQLFNKTGKTSAPAALAMVRNVEVKGQVSMVSWLGGPDPTSGHLL
jgi:hypothetical protein